MVVFAAELSQNSMNAGGNTDRFEELYCAALQENVLEPSDDEMIVNR